jgi:diaphanous 1
MSYCLMLYAGIVLSSTPVVQILDTTSTSPARPSMHQNSSAFPLTSHLHTPAVRLVSLHPLLSLTFAFLRVPQIHDGFEWSLFISRSTTAKDVIETVVDELGLSKKFPVLGGGKGSSFEYVLEEIWAEEDAEGKNYYYSNGDLKLFAESLLEFSRLPASTLISNIVESPFASNPFCSSARRSFRFCIPDEWFRRSKTRPATSTPLESSETTNKRLAESEEDRSTDDEGTAKQQKVAQAPRSHNDERDSPDWRSSLSQRRPSNLFDSLLGNSPSVSLKRASTISTHERVNVSEPTLVEHHTGSSGAGNGCGDSEESETEPDSTEFEKMLVCISDAIP